MNPLSKINARTSHRARKASISVLGGVVSLSLLLMFLPDAMAGKTRKPKQKPSNPRFGTVFSPQPPAPPSQNGDGPLPNGKAFQELANRIDRLRAQVRTQNADIEELTRDLSEAEAAIADLETTVSSKCEEIVALQSDIVDLRAKDEELMASLGGGLTQEQLVGLLMDPLFLQTAFLTQEFATIHDMLNADLAGEVESLSNIIEPVADCLLDLETCVLDIVEP